MIDTHERKTPDVGAGDVFSADGEGVDQGAIRRRMRICNDLGKMAPQGEGVVDYRVEGRQSFCSPVRGIIYATTRQAGVDLGEKVLHTTNARELFEYPRLIDDLNAMADADRAARAQDI